MHVSHPEIVKVLPVVEGTRVLWTPATERSWAAGFFDGEGCTHFGTGSPRLVITQNHWEPLERFRLAVGSLGRINGPYVRKATGGDYWTYTVQGNRIFLVLERMWPWLSWVKKEQACGVMAKCIERRIRRGGSGTLAGRKRDSNGRLLRRD